MSSQPPGTGPVQARPGLLLLASLLGVFITLLDVTVVNVALPTIRKDLDASLGDLQWVANAYLLALAVFIVTAGRLGDLYGRRNVYATGVAVFVLGSLVCGLAQSMLVLHAGRVVQGMGAAVIVPLSLAMIYAGFEGRQRTVGIAMWGAAGGLSTAAGPLIGGLLVSYANWQSIFLVNLPLGVIVLVATVLGVGHERSAGRRLTIDVGGLALVGTALLCLNLALINGSDRGWTSGGVLALFVGAAVATAAFLVAESRAADPVMTLSWFRRPAFTGSVLAGLLLGTGTFAMIFYLSIYLQTGLHLSPIQTGVRLLPLTVLIIVGAPVGGILAQKVGTGRALAAGMAMMSLGLLLMTRVDQDGPSGSWTTLVPGMLLTGFALGIAMPLTSELTISAAPQDQTGVASSVGTMFRQIGNAAGIAIMGAFLSHRTAAGGAPDVAVAVAVRDMAWFAVGISVAAVVVVLLLVRGSPAAAQPETVPVVSAGV